MTSPYFIKQSGAKTKLLFIKHDISLEELKSCLLTNESIAAYELFDILNNLEGVEKIPPSDSETSESSKKPNCLDYKIQLDASNTLKITVIHCRYRLGCYQYVSYKLFCFNDDLNDYGNNAAINVFNEYGLLQNSNHYTHGNLNYVIYYAYDKKDLTLQLPYISAEISYLPKTIKRKDLELSKLCLNNDLLVTSATIYTCDKKNKDIISFFIPYSDFVTHFECFDNLTQSEFEQQFINLSDDDVEILHMLYF